MKIDVFRVIKSKKHTAPLVTATVFLLLFASTMAVSIKQLDEPKNTPRTLQDMILVDASGYTLTEDLYFPNGHGFKIIEDGAWIDGADFKITGNKTIDRCEWITATDPAETTSAHGVLNAGCYDNVLIKSLEIENFATGIYLRGTGPDNLLDNRIENCSIHNNGLNDMGGSSSDSVTHGIHMCFAKNVEIVDNEIYNNEGSGSSCEAGGNGIYIHGGDGTPNNDVISGNKIHHNGKSGLWSKKAPSYIFITDNEFWENGNGAGIPPGAIGRGGIIIRCKASDWHTVENNYIHDNYGDGVFVGGNHNSILGNIITNNTQDGVNLFRNDGSKNNEIYENVICGNGEYDVYNYWADGGGNTGDENTGDTAYNYRDEGTTGDTYFTYSCNGDTEITSLPYTISVPGEYYLSGDLTCYDSSAAGITVEAENVIIDGRDYKITGTTTPVDCELKNPCHACGILNMGYDNLLIKDIEIETFGTGIVLEGISSDKIQGNIVQDSEIHDNGFDTMSGGFDMITHGIHVICAHGDSEVPGAIIKRNDIYNNHGTGGGCEAGGNGVDVLGGGNNPDDYVIVTYNKLYNNDKCGFWTKQQADHLEISYNEIYGNGGGIGMTDDLIGGVFLKCKSSNWNVVESNLVHDNYGDGIYVGGDNNDIINNTITSNTWHGVNLARNDGSQDNYIYENIICGNGEYDVYNYWADGGGNTGDENTGDTAYNYRDEGTTGDTYFTYSCSGDEPFVEISSITGGLGVSAIVTNTGTADAADVEWTITATGGVLGKINKEWAGTIPNVAVDEESKITGGIIFGFGLVTVTVEVICSANTAEESVDGKQILVFTLI